MSSNDDPAQFPPSGMAASATPWGSNVAPVTTTATVSGRQTADSAIRRGSGTCGWRGGGVGGGGGGLVPGGGGTDGGGGGGGSGGVVGGWPGRGGGPAAPGPAG